MTLIHPLQATNLQYAYSRTPVLAGLNITLPAGRVTVIAGPNGSGKSTLLDVLAGVRQPSAGEVACTGRVALVVQRPRIPAELPLTAWDVVALAAAAPVVRPSRRAVQAARGAGEDRLTCLRRRAAARAQQTLDMRVLASLDRVRAAELARAPYAELSGGQQQRVLIAQGLAVGAEVLLIDEPAAGLDPESRARTREILAEEALRGTAVGCVSHDSEDIRSADRVVELRRGRAVLRASPC